MKPPASDWLADKPPASDCITKTYCYPQRIQCTHNVCIPQRIPKTYAHNVYRRTRCGYMLWITNIRCGYTLWVQNDNVPTTYNTLWGTLPTTYRFTPTTYKIYTVGNIYVVGKIIYVVGTSPSLLEAVLSDSSGNLTAGFQYGTRLLLEGGLSIMLKDSADSIFFNLCECWMFVRCLKKRLPSVWNMK